MTDDTSLDKTKSDIFSHLVFFKTHFSAKGDNTPTEKKLFAMSLDNMERDFTWRNSWQNLPFPLKEYYLALE